MAETIIIPFPQKRAKKGFTSFYTKGEEIFNAVSHIVGGAVGVLALILGVVYAMPNPTHIVAMVVFALSILTLYTMSALYHFLPNGRAKGVFRIFDHCTIYLLIAGTYTPYCLIALGGSSLGLIILTVEWACAVGGIVMNAIAMNNRAVKAISMCFYIAMGWAIVVGIKPLIASISVASLWLLFAGGLVYTVGIIFYAFGKRVRYFHSVWHLFDLFGTVLQFASILLLL